VLGHLVLLTLFQGLFVDILEVLDPFRRQIHNRTLGLSVKNVVLDQGKIAVLVFLQVALFLVLLHLFVQINLRIL
jgi:hypothetical protein